jgi:putative intracellular protease/amidase
LFANAAEYNAVKELLKDPKLAHPKKLSAIAAGDLNQYVGIFVPGGHAPMEDLWKDASLGKILRHFHSKNQPTALICHGPIALLSTLDKPAELGKALESSHSANDKSVAEKPVTSKELWTYQGYRMTVFSDAEEMPNEPAALGGYMKFYPEDALRAAGGKLQIAPAKKSKVVQDRELITGQNPFSDKELAAAFLKALKFKGEVK